MSAHNPYPFHEGGFQERPQARGGKRGGQYGRGYYRPHEEVPRHEAWREDNFFEDFGEDPNVGDRALDKIKWKVPSFKGEMENLFMVRNYSDIVKVKLSIAEFSGYRIDLSKTNLPFSRSVVPKPQASTYKSWPKKEDTPKVAFKDHSKPKVEEKERLMANPTRYFTCNGVGHIAINCPPKKTLIFNDELNGWIERGEDDCCRDFSN
ncbi:hypothetical protein M9H77_26834 [Catharanthus roseus]|uniref:Uncharacterized protein n=1 Tax=Catharanthus roseus TaxID=4058 RepID=A0ACC0ABT1_CATRO|nr:hypothetical protein M9H77_26834 [Catharanthus roseus]